MKTGLVSFKNKIKNKFSINRDSVISFAVTVGVIFIASLIIAAFMLVITVENYDLKFIGILFSDVRVVLLNVLPVFFIMLILYFAFNRVWISYLFTGLIFYLIAVVNKFKVMFRGDPLVFEDIILVNEARTMTGTYKIIPDIVIVVILVAIIVLAVIGFKFFNRKLEGKCSKIIGAVLSLVLLVSSCNVFYFDNPSLHNSMWHPEFGNKYNPATQTMSHGIVYSFIKSIPDAFLKKPDGYKESEAKALLSNYGDFDIPGEKKVHTICVMLEAYNDFSKFEQVQFTIDPYMNYHALKEDSYSGDLFTNIFAGNTIVTERSFITGFNGSRFKMSPTPSYAWYFKSQGYYTEMIHPYYGWFYKRDKMSVNFGFDNFIHYDNCFKDVDGNDLEYELYWNQYISDYDFFDYIITGLDSAIKDNRKYFNFSVTFQNHGPYFSDKLIEEEYLLKKPEYNEADYNVINNYLSGIYKTDVALLKLRNSIDECEEPVVLIVFGDHNPHLGNNDESYHMLGIDIDLSTPEGAKNYYGTDYLFYANDAAKNVLGKEFKGVGTTVSPMMLMAEYFDYIDIQGPAYLNYLIDLKKEYPVINNVYVGKDGNYQAAVDIDDIKQLTVQQKIEYFLKTSKMAY